MPEFSPDGGEGEFLPTIPGTRVTFGPDGVTFTEPDGSAHTEPYDDETPADGDQVA